MTAGIWESDVDPIAVIRDFGKPTEEIVFRADGYRAFLKLCRRRIGNAGERIYLWIDGRWVDIERTEKVPRVRGKKDA